MKFLLSSKYFIKGGNENVKQKKRTEIKEPIILCLSDPANLSTYPTFTSVPEFRYSNTGSCSDI